jgi:7,8-dihydroneopterin aldolase/epimerase/oxygenase
MIVEVQGLELFGRHGVGEDERRDGQAFLVDVELQVDEPREDAIDATVDYRRVRDVARLVSGAKSYRLLETLAAAIAEALVAELHVERVQVRVRKPGVAWAEWTAATVARP